MGGFVNPYRDATKPPIGCQFHVTMSEVLKRLRKEAGWTQEEAAEAMNLSLGGYRKIEIGEREFRPKHMQAAARAFNVPMSLFVEEDKFADTRETGTPAQGGARRPPRRRSDDVVPAEVAFNRAGAPRDVPIYGTAAGSTLTGAGNGDVAVAAFQMEENPVSWALRPPALVGAKDIYALYVVNESMSPRHPPGDLVFVDPNRPVRFGDSCILHVQDAPHHDMQHLIAMFLRRTERTVDVQKLNPESVVSFPRGVVVRMHRVLTNNELFGV